MGKQRTVCDERRVQNPTSIGSMIFWPSWEVENFEEKSDVPSLGLAKGCGRDFYGP